MTPLAQLVSDLRTLLSAELGTVGDGKKAITVEPTEHPITQVTGLHCIVQRIPVGRPEPVTGGVYFPDEYVVKLIQYDRTKSVATAKRLIETNYVINRSIYIPPATTQNNYEQVRLHLFLPTITSK